MLPFLKPKTLAGLIITKRKPDDSAAGKPTEDDHMDGDDNHALMSAAEDLIKAVHSKDAAAVAAAWRAGSEILESEDEESSPQEQSGEEEGQE